MKAFYQANSNQCKSPGGCLQNGKVEVFQKLIYRKTEEASRKVKGKFMSRFSCKLSFTFVKNFFSPRIRNQIRKFPDTFVRAV